MATRHLQPNKRKASDKRLTAAEQLFVKAMQADPMMNPCNAAKAAGYKHPAQRANQLMKRPAVKAVLARELHDRQEKFEIRADEVLQELHHLAMARGEDLFDKKGNLIPISEMPERTRAAIKEFKVTEKIVDGGKGKKPVTLRTYEIKLHDKVSSIDMLMKHLGQYEKDNGQKPGLTLDLSSLYIRPAVRDPVVDAIAAQVPANIVEEPLKKVTHSIDEFEEGMPNE